ncbi:hypothetical protein [Agromyces sp. ZXT2-3]|uniref:hypothetical protein n=1 Tax=Agromyces sp. ZXT2-3 TaxID=3461152 RepID=UPI004054FA16
MAAASGEPAPSASLTVGDADPVTDAARRPWWRRRPPADHDRLARGIWWAGHVQLFIALALLVGCGALVIAGIARGDQGLSFSVLGLAMAGPFAMSGRMLRASSAWRTYWGPTDRRNWAPRAAVLVATVVGIAILSIVATTVIAYLMLPFIWSWSS